MIAIFAGGGTRLAAHIGIIKAVQELQIPLEAMVGVSGGSIIAALYAAGYPLEKITKITLETDFRQFRGHSLLSLLRYGGLSRGKAFEAWIDEKLEGRKFADLQIPLHVVATDVRHSKPVIFNAETSPDITIARAVRYSMSIPFLFSFETYDEHLLVDGSILSEDALVTQWTTESSPVICFRLRSDQEVENSHQSWLPLKNYLLLLIRTFMTSVSREFLSPRLWMTTVVVDTGNISPIDFGLTAEKKQWLLDRGYHTTMEFLPRKLTSSYAQWQTLLAGTSALN